MSTIYIEAFSGMSGDMFLSAFAALDNSYDILRDLPKKLGLRDAKIKISDVNKNGIVCKHVKVIDLNNTKKEHHRHLSDIQHIIDNAEILDTAKKIAKEIFLIIGKSESEIHNIPLEEIHFHEISGVDSIIDIVGCAILIDKLGIKKTYSMAVCTGFGFVNTQHGKLPVPAPATADILRDIPCYTGDEPGEKITPTGAAILKYLNPDFDVPVLIRKKTVYGPGEMSFVSPNVLRLSICELNNKQEKIFVMETNIDDMSGEFLGIDFQKDLMKNGAFDFYLTDVQMKKSRKGVLLTCLTNKKDIKQLSNFILENTTTIGVRYYPVNRIYLEREFKKFNSTKYGEVNIKVVTTPTGKKRMKIEYDDLVILNKKWKLPLQTLKQEIIKTINFEELYT